MRELARPGNERGPCQLRGARTIILTPMFSVEDLKQRKLVQWGVAYLAGAWVVLQLLDVVAEPWGIGSGVLVAAQILLAAGFLATLVLAWYHGEQGRQRVSGPELLMLAALLVIAGGVIALVRGGIDDDARSGDTAEATMAAGFETIPERSIAVLPLENQSPAEEHAYLAPALTDEITDALTRVPDLRVTSYNSAAQYAGSGKTVRQFALEDLGVAHVIEGSVQRLGDEVRIRVQLIDARTDEHIWSETYQKKLASVFDAQVEIARQVADKLAASFSEREMEVMRSGATEDPVAYELFLSASGVPVEEAIRLLRQAVERDPEFGTAWFRLSFAYGDLASREGPEWADSARIMWQRGIEFTENRAFRLTARAVAASRFEGDNEKAALLIREALEAGPTFSLALSQGVDILEDVGDLRSALRLARQNAALNPLDVWRWIDLASLYIQVGMDERAEEAIRRAMEVEPTHPASWNVLARLRGLQNRAPEALAALDSAEARGGTADYRRGWVYLVAGDESLARESMETYYDSVDPDNFFAFDELAHLRLAQADTAGAEALLEQGEEVIQRLRVPPDPNMLAFHANEAQIAAVRGDVDAAVASFRAYIDGGGRSARDIARNPVYSRVRDDPAFQSVLNELQEILDRQHRQIERDLAEER